MRLALWYAFMFKMEVVSCNLCPNEIFRRCENFTSRQNMMNNQWKEDNVSQQE